MPSWIQRERAVARTAERQRAIVIARIPERATDARGEVVEREYRFPNAEDGQSGVGAVLEEESTRGIYPKGERHSRYKS